MEYHRSNKSPLCGLTPAPIATQIRYSYYIFLSHVWEEEVSLDHSGSQPFNYCIAKIFISYLLLSHAVFNVHALYNQSGIIQ